MRRMLSSSHGFRALWSSNRTATPRWASPHGLGLGLAFRVFTAARPANPAACGVGLASSCGLPPPHRDRSALAALVSGSLLRLPVPEERETSTSPRICRLIVKSDRVSVALSLVPSTHRSMRTEDTPSEERGGRKRRQGLYNPWLLDAHEVALSLGGIQWKVATYWLPRPLWRSSASVGFPVPP